MEDWCNIKHISDFNHINMVIEQGVKDALIDIDNTLAKARITDLYLWIKRKEFKNGDFKKVKVASAAVTWGYDSEELILKGNGYLLF